MNRPILKDYQAVIKALPLKKKYNKEELLIPELRVEAEGKLEIYYTPHNEQMNEKAKVFIVGITPGFTQMNTAITAARQGLEENLSLEETAYFCKSQARVSGPIRKSIIKMLNELEIGQYLGILDAAELFEKRDDLLHTTSVIPFAVFINGKNYTGHQPDLLKTSVLRKYIEEDFMPQLEAVPRALVIPLGKGVEEVLSYAVSQGKISEERCLWGFPHPSGANVNGRKQFEAEKENMKHQMEKWYNRVR